MENLLPSLQDFSTVNSYINKYKKDYKLQDGIILCRWIERIVRGEENRQQ